MSRAPLYLITLEDEDDDGFNTGVLIGKVRAINPEEAAVQLADKELDEATQQLTPKARVHLMRNLYKQIEDDIGEQELVIYPVQRNKNGGTEKYSIDDLKYDKE